MQAAGAQSTGALLHEGRNERAPISTKTRSGPAVKTGSRTALPARQSSLCDLPMQRIDQRRLAPLLVKGGFMQLRIDVGVGIAAEA